MSTYDFDSTEDEPFQDEAASLVDDLSEPDDSLVAAADDPLFGGFDIGALAAQLVGPAVQKAIGKKVDALAAEAVTAALTPELLDQLRAEAEEAAETVVHGPQASQSGTADAVPAPVAGVEEEEEEAPPPYFGSTNEFVRDYLRHVYKRRINGQNTFWSPRWWASAEATARLEALWRAWEHLRLDPSTGPSVWWRDHADPHMSVLLSSAGPFSKEIDVKATILEPLPHEEPPDGLFPDVREVS